MTTYIYGAKLSREDDSFVLEVPGFTWCVGGGATLQEACENTAMGLRLIIAEYLENNRELPKPVFSDNSLAVLCVDVDDSFLMKSKCMTIGEAAEELEISSGRVSQLASSGALKVVVINGKRMVTIESVNARKVHPPAAHRPRKARKDTPLSSYITQ